MARPKVNATLNYYIMHASFNWEKLKARSTDDFNDLRQAIYKQNQFMLADVCTAASMDVYTPSNLTADSPDTMYSRAQICIAPLMQVDYRDTVKKVFSKETLDMRYIHVVLVPRSRSSRDVSPGGSKRKRPEEVEKDQDEEAHRNKVLKQAPMEAPSVVGTSKYFCESSKISVFDFNRPACPGSIPLSLLHPVFGTFYDDLRDQTPLAMKDYNFADEFRHKMAKFYSKEDTRAHQMREALVEYLNIQVEASRVPLSVSSFTTDGHRRVGTFCSTIIEVKNEIGSGSAEPFLQAGAYYLNFARNRELCKTGTVLPCIILCAAGPHIGFSGAAFPNKIRQDVLTPLLEMAFHHTDDEAFVALVRALHAYKNAVLALEQYYSELPLRQAGLSLSTQKPQLSYPYPRSYHHVDDTRRLIGFTYIGPMSTGTLVFTAINDDERPIVVKFVRRYSTDVHDWCAERLHAPKWLACEQLAGHWQMIVMEPVDPNTYCGLTKRRKVLSKEQMQGLRERLTEFISALNNAKFVHGDLRDPNVLVNEDGTDFQLVDFDWAGRLGETRYPATLNMLTVHRPEDVTSEELIAEAHDGKMLEYMFK